MIRRRCPVQLCKGRRGPGHLFCRNCWARLPSWLRDAIATERDNCRLAQIFHSQELLALRDKACQILAAANRERFAKPQGVQLPLSSLEPS